MKIKSIILLMCMVWFCSFTSQAQVIPNNEIRYKAKAKLVETTDENSKGLHTNAFNVSILKHTFVNGNGVIKFNGAVTTIGENAFRSCPITNINLPNSITSIGKHSFLWCNNLANIAIPKSVNSIARYAFSDATSKITSIKVNPGNSTFDSRNNCNAIIETASNRLILGCKNTIIPNTVKIIGTQAFSKCKTLTNITIPNSVIEIEDFAFDWCQNLTNVTLSNSLINIGRFAFMWCKSLESILIPKSVKSIGSKAFSDCPALANIRVEYGNNKYDSRENCNAIIETENDKLLFGCKNTIIPNTVKEIGISAFEGSAISNIEIPNSVTFISPAAFSECDNLTSITIPNSVNTIFDDTFEHCENLTSITMPRGLKIEGPRGDVETFEDCDASIHRVSSSSSSSSKKSNSGSSNNLCSRCSGSGYLMGQPCPFCSGTGRIVWNVNPDNFTPSGGGYVTPSNSDGGSGAPQRDYHNHKCFKCNQTGRYTCPCHSVVNFGTTSYHKCSNCGQEHKVGTTHTCTCNTCGGDGVK